MYSNSLSFLSTQELKLVENIPPQYEGDILSTQVDVTMEWMLEDLLADKSTLVQVNTWCRQAQAVTWTNAEQDPRRHMASVCHNGLIV